MYPAILSQFLALAGPSEIQRIDVEESEAATSVLAYDDTGEVAAEIVIRQSPNGEVVLDALFPDGLYMSAVNDGETVTVDTEDGDEVAARLEKILAAMPETETTESVIPCIVASGAAAVHCAGLRLIMCGVELYVATCTCVPQFKEDFSCKGW